jgi:hypothetical protein
MRTPGLVRGSDRWLEAEALIQEARRHQRGRHRSAGLAILVAIAVAAGAFTGFSLAGSHPEPKRTASDSGNSAGPGPAPGGIASTLVMWPVVPRGSTAGFGPGCTGSGPDAYLDDLGTGRLSQRDLPCITGGDFPVAVLQAGRWLVYNGTSGVTAIPDDLRGRPRVLGDATEMLPSVSPGRVWLQTDGPPAADPEAEGPVTIQSVSVGNGKRGRGSCCPGERTWSRERMRACCWRPRVRLSSCGLPRARPRQVAQLANSNGWLAADGRLAACESGWRSFHGSSDTPPATVISSTFVYQACRMLRVVNLVTGKLLSFPAPAGTLGWVPNELTDVDAISPGNTMLAAQAAARPARHGIGRFFIVHFTGARTLPAAVPGSAATVNAITAWSADGSWLFYQGGHYPRRRVAAGPGIPPLGLRTAQPLRPVSATERFIRPGRALAHRRATWSRVARAHGRYRRQVEAPADDGIQFCLQRANRAATSR